MEERKELAVRRAQSYIEDIDIAQVKHTMDKIKQFQHVVMSTLEEGQDYGRIAGINKPILFKSGAEKLMMLMGLRTEFDIIDSTRDFQNEFFQYQVKCRVLRGDTVITEGLGSCNTNGKSYKRLAVLLERIVNIGGTYRLVKYSPYRPASLPTTASSLSSDPDIPHGCRQP